jgi:D-alanine-D-alanine ligase
MTQKINKYIEIVMLSEDQNGVFDHKKVGDDLDEKALLEILSKKYQKVSISVINTRDDLEKLVAKRPDLVFSGIRYFCFYDATKESSQEVWLTDYLDDHNIAYIGSNREALMRESHKSCAKKSVLESNINTAPFFTTQPGEHPTIDSIPLSFPLFIKPDVGGNSIGIDMNSFVSDFQEFQDKVSTIFRDHHTRSLVERYLSGNEYSVGIFENYSTGCFTAIPVEIITYKNKDGHRILDFNVKNKDAETIVEVADLNIKTQISSLAINAFKVLGGHSYGRIDVKMDAAGIPHFIEANFMAGLRKGYLYRACNINQKMSYEQMILMIADIGLSSKKIGHRVSSKLGDRDLLGV